jgi:chemotaxis protein CheC
MKTSSELNFDALSEIIRIGTVCAVQGLSEVIGESVQSFVANVNVVNVKNVNVATLRLNAENFGVVTQEFTGGLNAEVMLLFTEESALHIVENMVGIEMDGDAVREVESEAMCELGNIMIHACSSSIANALHISIESSLPRYTIQSCDEIVTTIQNHENQDLILISHMDLVIKHRPIEAKLLFLMKRTTS